jgi:RNA-directed DNA polymerase
MESSEGNTMGISRSETVSTGQRRIAELAKQAPQMSFTSINRYLTTDWLKEAYRLTRKDGAAGVDAQTAADYANKLEDNLQLLANLAHSGTYFAPPVKRAFIPKGSATGELRPIGIPTFEDKVLQRAVVMLLEPIYEQDFLPCSYGFRPGRSQHQCLKDLSYEIVKTGGGWILEVDIRKFFDTLDIAHLRQFLEQRVNDGVVTKLIHKWLKAGVWDKGEISYPESGCPQGGVVSPLASNVYLHHVLDLWFEHEVKQRLRGKASLYRWADDFIVLFQYKEDADRVLKVLAQRFEKYGLAIHPDKTRLTDFVNPTDWHNRGSGEPGTFNFLGFTFYWAKTRNGKWSPKQKTAKDRLRRGITKIHEWCRTNRHLSVKEQHKALNAKLRGHYQYFGVTGNTSRLNQLRRAALRSWRFWLNRRSNDAGMTWEKFYRLTDRYSLLRPIIAHAAPVR